MGRENKEERERFIYLGKSGNVSKKEPYIKARIDLNRPGWGRGMEKQDNTDVENSTNRAGRQESKEHVE